MNPQADISQKIMTQVFIEGLFLDMQIFELLFYRWRRIFLQLRVQNEFAASIQS